MKFNFDFLLHSFWIYQSKPFVNQLLKPWLIVWIVVLLPLWLASCGKPLPSFDDIEMINWINDKQACAGVRAEDSVSLRLQKDKLLSLSELDVVQVLGKPDVNELSKRNQKVFYYYIESGPDCGQALADNPTVLAIRFNAVGLAKEVRLEKLYR